MKIFPNLPLLGDKPASLLRLALAILCAMCGATPAMAVETAPVGDVTTASDLDYLYVLEGTTWVRTFHVGYTDPEGIDLSSLDVNDITLTGPGGALNVIAQVIFPLSPGNRRPVEYYVVPANGSWDASHDGDYTVTVNANQVFDTTGCPAVAASVGTLHVGVELLVLSFENVNSGPDGLEFDVKLPIECASLETIFPHTIEYHTAEHDVVIDYYQQRFEINITSNGAHDRWVLLVPPLSCAFSNFDVLHPADAGGQLYEHATTDYGFHVVVGTPPGVIPPHHLGEDFSATTQPAGLDSSAAGTTATFNGSTATFPGVGVGGRSYQRTDLADYNVWRTVTEVTVTLSGGGEAGAAFFGMGVGEPLAPSGEPGTGAHVYLRAAPDDFGGGVALTDGGVTSSPPGLVAGDGTHRLQMIHDPAAQTIQFAIARNYTGGRFIPTATSAPLDVSDNGFDGTNARLFFGGAANLTFDDLVIRQVSVWTGARSNRWETPGNWDPALLPVDSGNLEFPPRAPSLIYPYVVDLMIDRTANMITFLGEGYNLQFAKLTLGSGVLDVRENAQITSTLAGAFDLVKTGSGTLTMVGHPFTYFGAVTINEGALLSRSQILSAIGSGPVQVNNGATLGGDIVAGPITVAPGGTLNPGLLNLAGARFLRAASNVTIAGSLKCEINGPNSDRLDVTGTLDLQNATLDIDDLACGTTENVYIIATYGALVGSSFANVLDLPTGSATDYWALDYAYNDGSSTKNIALVRLPLQPILHWALEEGSGATTTESVTGETGVAELVKTQAWTTGIAPGSSYAINFADTAPASYIDAGTRESGDGGAYVPAASATSSATLGDWTITAWVNIPAGMPASDRCIASSDTDDSGWWSFFVRGAGGIDNNLSFNFSGGEVQSGLDVPTDRPVLVSIAADSSGSAFTGSNTYRFAIWDGLSWQTAEGLAHKFVRLADLEIGSFETGTLQFQGVIDEVCIFDGALTATQLDGLPPAPTRYEMWRRARGLTFGVNDGMGDDPNQDGQPNITHFAFDTDPLGDGTDEDKRSLTFATIDGADHLTLTFPVRANVVFNGITLISQPMDCISYSVRANTDLQDPWDLQIIEMTPALDSGLPPLGDYDGLPGPDWEYRTFVLRDVVGAHQRAFMKVGVTEP